ncbi:MAG: xylose isomerase [Planctomycetes bacterium]|nr:xylose isomerase [Planctomycetota bacterium]
MYYRRGVFRLGYNTNGLAHHRVCDALELCGELGFEAVALTPDAGLLDPYRLKADEVAEVRLRADDLGLELSVETGSRFLLDPRRKHYPTLLEEDRKDRERRVDFLARCIDLAAELGAGVVSLWAGKAPDGSVGDPQKAGDSKVFEALWERLCEGLSTVLERGRGQGVRIAFEPEPGMFIERPAGYDELCRRLGSTGAELGLCLDVGHLLCTGDLPVEGVISRYISSLQMVHLDDIEGGVHVHRMFGEGDLDLPATLRALIAGGYSGICAVELSRDGHRGPEAAREAMSHLRKALVGMAPS